MKNSWLVSISRLKSRCGVCPEKSINDVDHNASLWRWGLGLSQVLPVWSFVLSWSCSCKRSVCLPKRQSVMYFHTVTFTWIIYSRFNRTLTWRLRLLELFSSRWHSRCRGASSGLLPELRTSPKFKNRILDTRQVTDKHVLLSTDQPFNMKDGICPTKHGGDVTDSFRTLAEISLVSLTKALLRMCAGSLIWIILEHLLFPDSLLASTRTSAGAAECACAGDCESFG